MEYRLASSDPVLLGRARKIAAEFATARTDGTVTGIVFLGALARGYFDRGADIDIAFFTTGDSALKAIAKFRKIEGIEVHCHVSGYDEELRSGWDMAKRWTYSEGSVFHDPDGKIRRLLDEKVPLRPEERKWLLMSGLTLSEWYANRLSALWIERGDVGSAHFMFNRGLNYFFDMLFALNGRLVPDDKWKFHCAGKLDRLPPGYDGLVRNVMTVRNVSAEDLGTRVKAFLEMWNPMVRVVEEELSMSYEEIMNLV